MTDKNKICSSNNYIYHTSSTMVIYLPVCSSLILYTTARTEAFPAIVKRKIIVYTISRKIFDPNGSFINWTPDSVAAAVVLLLTRFVAFVGSITLFFSSRRLTLPWIHRNYSYHQFMHNRRRPFWASGNNISTVRLGVKLVLNITVHSNDEAFLMDLS